jgi:hypothetical protein
MAGESFSTIGPVLSQLYSAKLADQRNMDAIELGVVPIVPNDSGKNIAWTAKFDGTKAATVFAELTAVDRSTEFTKTKKVAATLNFGQYRSPAQVGELAAILAASAQGSPDELLRLVDSEIKDSLTQLAKQIATDFYTGTGTSGGNPNIVGLAGGAALSTGTYAGIDRATDTQWAANVLSNGSVDRPLTDDLLRQAEVAVFNAGGQPPDMILTTGNVHRKYAGLMTPMLRINGPGAAPSQMGMLGANDLFWGNMPVKRSARCPAKKLFMFSRSNVRFVFPSVYIPQASVPTNAYAQRMALDLKNQYMLPIIVTPMANVGNTLEFNVTAYVQLQVIDPNAVATITDISES